ncbi:KAP family P-loop NTPase fold protein [Halosimplex salinum]|uniref:KAP family P-loop NTPase fold protein n=1 Tax=Halosimplex salinum TaxID=1710538 RepID=UPI000F471B63|nr:P-loop NTPase fold protein [Halosimplex salinum]
MPPENEDLFLPDRAITSEKDDEFGHTEYADSLERILRNADPPWHIGIFGEWGSGKTSIIRMLFERLRNKEEFDDTIFVEFDAWSHAEGSIRTELLLELDQQIGNQIGQPEGVLTEEEITGRLYDVEEEEVEGESQGVWTEFIEFITDETHLVIITLLLVIISGTFAYFGLPEVSIGVLTLLLAPLFVSMAKRLSDATDTLQKKFLHPRKEWSGSYQRIFEGIIEESEADTIVISIDNLDRCESSTVYEVLVSLKTFMENDNCIYLIPCDDKALESHIKSIDKGDYFEADKNEREFLRKFFQTHIRIPPFLPEDIEKYAENESVKLSEPFCEEALDVVTNAYIDNPRRIKHALNRLSTLRVLAEEIEETGALTEGRVTANIPFLAKISILEEEYPEFYETLSENPRLLGNINDYFRDQLSDSDKRERVKAVLEPDENGKNGEQESRLEAFLRSTRRIHVENPNPFLNLSEPSYATSLTDVDAFLQNLRTGQEEEVRKELEQVENYSPYVGAIENTFEEYTTKRREQPLFGSIDTTISVFEEFDQRSQGRLTQLLGEYLTTDLGRGFLIELEAESVFPLVLQMRDSESKSLLREYASLTADGTELQENILQAFIDHAEDIPQGIAQDVSKQIESLSDEQFKTALKKIESSSDAKDRFIRFETLELAVSLIELEDNANEYVNTELYTLFEDVASKKARGKYVTHLLDYRLSYSGNQEQIVDKELSGLLLDIEGDILQSDGEEALESIQKIVEGQNNQHTIDIVEIGFHFYESFPQSSKQEFHEWMAGLFESRNVNDIERIFEMSEEYKVSIVKTETEARSILQRIPNPIDNESLVKSRIVPEISEEFNQQLIERMKYLIRQNNNNHSQLGTTIFAEYPDRFESKWGELIELCGNQASNENNVTLKRRYLEPISEIFGKLDGPQQENFISQMDDLLRGNHNDNKLYRDLWNNIQPDTDTDRKETVAGDVRNELVQSFNRNQNPSHLDPLIEVLSSLTEHIGEENGQSFMDRLSKQLTQSNLNDSHKSNVIDQISEFDEFYGKEEQILDRIENLLTQTDHNHVTDSAAILLDKFERLEVVDDARLDQIRNDHLSE